MAAQQTALIPSHDGSPESTGIASGISKPTHEQLPHIGDATSVESCTGTSVVVLSLVVVVSVTVPLSPIVVEAEHAVTALMPARSAIVRVTEMT